MNAEERRNSIMSLLKEKKEVKINDLNGMFNVSNVTIRNDLIFLERTGVAKRLFGKVVLKEDMTRNLNISETKNIAQKEKIGKYAAKLIQAGDSILFYTGSTTQQIIRFIDPQLSFIAVTNSIFIANELRYLPNAKTILIGGNFSNEIGATFGPQAIKQISEYNFDKTFLAVDGIDWEMGITNTQPLENDINRAILERSKTVIVVADYSKIGNVTFIQMGNIDDVDMLITDSKASLEHIENIKTKGVNVITVSQHRPANILI